MTRQTPWCSSTLPLIQVNAAACKRRSTLGRVAHTDVAEWAVFGGSRPVAFGPLAPRISMSASSLSLVNGTQTVFRASSLESIAGINADTISLSLSLANLTGRQQLTIYSGAFSAPHAITATLLDGTQQRGVFTQTLNATFNDLDSPIVMHGGERDRLQTTSLAGLRFHTDGAVLQRRRDVKRRVEAPVRCDDRCGQAATDADWEE